MAKKGLDLPISSNDESWQPYSRKRVEEHLKARLGRLTAEKIGYARVSEKNETTGFRNFQGFADAEEAAEYDMLIAAGKIDEAKDHIVVECEIPIAESEEVTTYPISLTAQSTATVVSIDGSVKVAVRFESWRKEPKQEREWNPCTGKLCIETRTNSSQAWAEKAVVNIEARSSGYDEVDVSKYIDADRKGVQMRLHVEAEVGGAARQTATVMWSSITKTTLAVEYQGDWHNELKSRELNTAYHIAGVADKVLHVITTSPSGDTTPYAINVGDGQYTSNYFRNLKLYLADEHGVHTIESWVSVKDEDEKRSPSVFNRVMYAKNADDTTPYVMIQDISKGQPIETENFTGGDLFRYAVYNPSGEQISLAFALRDLYGNTYATYQLDTAVQTKHTFSAPIEIEGVSEDEINAYFYAEIDGADQPYAGGFAIKVDNSAGFYPTQGADFILNPKARSNSEMNPGTIVNAANDQVMEGAVFTGFTFADGKNGGEGVDGWTVDANGVRCLKVPAGRRVEIPYDLWSNYRTNGATTPLHIEIDAMTSNVIDEETPIIAAANGSQNKGLLMMPLKGAVFTDTKNSMDAQAFFWKEDRRTRFSINIIPDYKATPDVPAIPICRVAIDSVINREFVFSTSSSSEFVDSEQGKTIVIGQDDADIYIYGIRIYKGSPISEGDIRKNYMASLPTSAEKLDYISRNDIMENNAVSLKKVKEKGLNVWCYNPKNGTTIASKEHAASGGDTNKGKTGDLYLWMYNEDGSEDKAHSGVINDTEHKNQGTTANSYAEHNQQDKFGNTSMFTDGYGVQHFGYPLADDVNEAKKLVLKINWASSMQSHKAGATALYNDLYMRICAGDKAMLQGANNKNRVAVLQKPVYVFVGDPGDEANPPKFLGLGTFGPGKMDKPTWGYTSEYPEFAMFEGSDNNGVLTDMRCPWDDSVVYDAKEEFFTKNEEASFDFDAGATDSDKTPTGEGFEAMKAAVNFLYSHNPFVKPYVGSLASLRNEDLASFNTNYLYWTTQGEGSNKLYRWNPDKTKSGGGEWVNAGVNGEEVDVSALTAGKTPDAANAAIIDARVQGFKASIDGGNYLYKLDLLFNRAFGKLFACSDNQSKNTYYAAVRDTSGKVRIALHADDLDTIMKTDNVGALTKDYWAEERDTIGNTTSYYWQGQYNVLFQLIDLAFADEVRDMMRTMFEQMGNLCKGAVRTAAQCIEEYFFSIQEYFCETAYNETARVRYEANQALSTIYDLKGSRGTAPLEQSTGDQLQCEREFMEKRLTYLSSWCHYGIFGSDDNTVAGGAWKFSVSSNPNGGNVNIKFKLTPHQWIYASGSNGVSYTRSDVRMKPGEQYDFVLSENVSVQSDTQFMLCGIDYFRSVGNLGNMPIGKEGNTLDMSGKHLTEFIANPTAEGGAEVQFRPGGVTFGNSPMLKTISLKGCPGISSAMDLGNMPRLVSVDVSGTKVAGVSLPKTSTLTEVYLSAATTSVAVDGQTNLSTLSIPGKENLTSFKLAGKHDLNSYDLITDIKAASPANLTEIQIDSIEWGACSTEMLMWLADRRATLNGIITMHSTNGAIGWNDKVALGKVYGNIDSDENHLKVNYAINTMQAAQLSVICLSYMFTPGRRYDVEPGSSASGINNFALTDDGEIDYSIAIEANDYAVVDGRQILCNKAANEGSSRKAITLTLNMMNGTTLTATRKVAFWQRIPKIGDFAYANGTFDEEYIPAAPIVGIVYKVDADANDSKKYIVRVVAMQSGNDDPEAMWGMMKDSWSTAGEIKEHVLSAFNPTQRLYQGTGPSNPGQWFEWTNSGNVMDGAYADLNGKDHTDKIVGVCGEMIEYVRDYCGGTGLRMPETAAEISTMTNIVAEKANSSYPSQVLFVPALTCHLYEPNAAGLSDQYKKGNWYLPALGELGLIMYYASKGLNASDWDASLEGDAVAIFALAAMHAGKSSVFSIKCGDCWYWSSTERYEHCAWMAQSHAVAQNGYKGNGSRFRAVAAFKFEF